MSNTEELQKTSTSRFNQKPHDSPRMVCDLGKAQAFTESSFTPHVPVLAAFGEEPLHTCRLRGSWDLDRAVSENAGTLVRSIRRIDFNKTEASSSRWDDLTFQFGPRAFLYADEERLVGFAAAPDEAERLVSQFGKAYPKTPKPAGGTFHLIKEDASDVTCQAVTLPPATTLSSQALNLHYCAGTAGWHRNFVEKLQHRLYGLSIFEADNQEQVSAILNLSDGMLADFLRLQIICTINCSTADIDPALLRPGRLICHRIFDRLEYAQAARLAENLGKKLPPGRDYSLAEVFAGHDAEEINRPRIGFAP